jgi:hypothetical protein
VINITEIASKKRYQFIRLVDCRSMVLPPALLAIERRRGPEMCPSRGFFFFEEKRRGCPTTCQAPMQSTIFVMVRFQLWEDANGLDFDPRVGSKANALCDAVRPSIC